MTEVRTIGIAPEKRSFQLHGVRADGSAAFRKQVSRGRVPAEPSSPPRCAAAMEACASAQDRGRGSPLWGARFGWPLRFM